jgi:hypothetical protein
LSLGTTTVLIPSLLAASNFSLRPPTDSTAPGVSAQSRSSHPHHAPLPPKLTSPVIAVERISFYCLER